MSKCKECEQTKHANARLQASEASYAEENAALKSRLALAESVVNAATTLRDEILSSGTHQTWKGVNHALSAYATYSAITATEDMMKHIVKVQRPLSGPGPWMVYDKDRRRTAFIEENKVEPNVREAMGSAPKRYFNAIWSPVDGWKLLEPTLEQTW